MENNEKIRIGISECLLGHEVRYDGGHKHDGFLTGTLGRYVDYVAVCPEVEYGLSVPREAMRLEGDLERPRLVSIKTRVDHTEGMLAYARTRTESLEAENLCGFIFKSKSPSSGMERVKVYTGSGAPVKKGVGLFAGVFKAHFPLVPVEEEGRLHDPVLRENFIERIFAMKRWRDLLDSGRHIGGLVAFHSRNKLLILSHSPQIHREMGKLVAAAKSTGTAEAFAQYESLMMRALSLKATPGKHANVLQHMLGYFKKDLTPDEKQEILEIIDKYKQGSVPLIVPATLMQHYVRKYEQHYLAQQTYLNPHPLELKLRNHV
ncbi:MAG TPA: DUF1722 domain-containing protein [Desulfobacteraceae bacterium]|nr:DUF1722 domain-containing protein [Desulfobacteraceae bacterium]